MALGGFAIAFSIDDADQRRRESLRLNARLVAKPAQCVLPRHVVRALGPRRAGGQPLQPDGGPGVQGAQPGDRGEHDAGVRGGAAGLLLQLRHGLGADPVDRRGPGGPGLARREARPVGDEGQRGVPAHRVCRSTTGRCSTSSSRRSGTSTRTVAMPTAPRRTCRLVANPLSGLGPVSLNLQFANSAVATVCRYDGNDATTLPLRTEGRQAVGHRFVLGLVSLSAARRYNLRTADLQTATTLAPTATFADAGGRTFVSGDSAGLAAAAPLLKPDVEDGTWALDYAALSTAKGSKAYPGALPVSAVFPTSALDAATAARRRASCATPVARVSAPARPTASLPAGYLPLTAENGFGGEESYLASAVVAVRTQKGAVPAVGAAPATTLAKACDFSKAAPPVKTPPKNTDQSGPGTGVAPAVAGPAGVVPSAAGGGPAVAAPSAAAAGDQARAHLGGALLPGPGRAADTAADGRAVRGGRWRAALAGVCCRPASRPPGRIVRGGRDDPRAHRARPDRGPQR
ncbi:hypothetical protein G5V59_06180 [Nocardioides sp. W3-2-3]|uniref:hypothetical protein n=1 Tax=Nocardioides convexus TaxID=2712224 RepID=UPI0024186CA8|nr:hypothetical protein [Nocardioides convexus]NGZ99965.1 hypothetical protein [Nocardioides convexus]